MLTNYVSPRNFEYIKHCLKYDEAIGVLKAQYVKPANEVFARHLLATRWQKNQETLDELLLVLKSLSKVCNFQNVAEIVYRDEAVRDAFITGLLSNTICQRFLENNTLDISRMFTQAHSLDAVQKSSESYKSLNHQFPTTATALSLPQQAP